MFGELIIGLQGSPQHLEKSTTTKNKDKNSCKIKKKVIPFNIILFFCYQDRKHNYGIEWHLN